MSNNQRIYQIKKPRRRTRRPKTGLWLEFNAAILLNIWSAIIPPSFSFDTMDPSLSWGGTFFVDSYMDTDTDMDTDMDMDMETDLDTDMDTDMETDMDMDMDKDMESAI